MTPTKLTVFAVTFAVIGIGATTAFAKKPVVSFCSQSEKSCMNAYVANKSSATVTSVKITQKAKHGCEKVEKRISRNRVGTVLPSLNSGKLAMLVDKNCRYEVSFKTTKGCVGNKNGQFSRKNLQKERDTMELRGACGTLSTGITIHDTE